MKKISILLLVALISAPAIANEYDYDDYDTYDEETYNAPAPVTPVASTAKRDTYAGLRIHRNEHITYQFSSNGNHDTTVRDNNFGIGLTFGNRLTEYVKLEFETLYTGKQESKHNTDFNYDIWSNMLNMSLYKNYGGAVEPYVGLGIGLSGLWADIDGAWEKSKDCDFDLSFAVMVGVNFALNEYIDLNLGLRYIDYGTIKHDNSSTKVEATEIYIGAAYKFSIFKK
ncbi:MAG: porin family protein [Alphaproteobacteria bacterium]|nr:porin family protein [Alphaproteobacteria bacterium]